MKRLIYCVSSLLVGLFTLFLGALPALALNSGPVWQYALTVKTGQNPGTVNVSWSDDGATNQYNLQYGTEQGKYTFGALNLPFAKLMSNNFEVGQLSGGTTYYFSLVGETGGEPKTSGPVAAVAKTGTATPKVAASSGPVWPYNFWAKTGTKAGTVELSWTDDGTANKYDLVYGLTPGQYLWGAQGMAFTSMTTNTFTVSYLTSGVRYYFALVGEKDNNVVSWGQAISAVAR